MRWQNAFRHYGVVILIVLAACTTPASPTSTPAPTVDELVLYDWEGDLPTSVLEAFTQTYGIPVTYEVYENQEEALEDVRSGNRYDVFVLESHLIPGAINAGVLAEIDYRNIPNFKNISANFRDLTMDPGNRYTVPYSWGTTGLVIPAELAGSITHWADLWDPENNWMIAGWNMPRYMLGMALKSLGYSINTEKPEEVEAALERLLALKPRIILLGEDASVAPLLASGEAQIGLGWSYDFIAARNLGMDVVYVLPEEGALLWGDNFTIPANAPHKAAAELFINFLLQPQISAKIISETYYWLPNDLVSEFVAPEIRTDPIVFPSNKTLKNAEIILPLSPSGETLYNQIWQRFLDAD